MKTGVSTASLFLRENNEDALPLLHSLGVKTAEVFLTSFSEYGREFANLLAERKGDLHINSLHVLNTEFEPQFFNLHPRARADAYAWLEKVLDSANILGAKHYTFHGIARVKRASRSGENDNIARMIEQFRPLVQACEARGVRLCLENVEWATYNRAGFFSLLKNELPSLLGVLDIKQARISQYPYEAYIQDMGSRLAYAHISDIDENGKIRLPGQGKFDFETLIKRLKDIGFDGALLIEVYTDDYDGVKQLQTACAYLDELLYKHGVLSS